MKSEHDITRGRLLGRGPDAWRGSRHQQKSAAVSRPAALFRERPL